MKPAVIAALGLGFTAMAACATPPPAPPAPPPLPANAEQIATWLVGQRITCVDADPATQAARGPAADGRVRPTYARRCMTEFPRHMLLRDVEAACHVTFDIDVAGLASRPSTRCNLGAAAVPEEVETMRAMYVALAQRVATAQRFAPLESERPGAVRSSLVQQVRFAIDLPRAARPPYPEPIVSVASDQPKALILQ
jgi:hypothetical protein